MTDLSFKNWQVELLRVTAFHEDVSENKEGWTNWWTTLVGVPSEKTEVRRRDAILHEVGPFRGGDLILGLAPGRIDWHLRASDKANENETNDGNIVSLTHDAINGFHDLILRWMKLDSCPLVKRLALGAILLQPVENKQAGYQKLGSYLHSLKVAPESSDFLYQINRPREIRIDGSGLQINRLCKWSVALLGKLSFSFSMGVKNTKSVTSSMEGHNACRLELDVNTTPENEAEFSREMLSKIFNELVGQAQEIAEKGDVP